MDNSFTIDSCVSTLCLNKDGHVILDGKTKYIVPVYQRPYAWEEEQIEKFIKDLFISFWGIERKSSPEPLFYGTIQLSSNNDNTFEIIDGQQRLSTILLLLLILRSMFPKNPQLKESEFEWLTTQVNNGKEQEYLNEVIKIRDTIATLKMDKRKKNSNIYIKNAVFIKNLVTNIIYSDDDELEILENVDNTINDFIIYLFSNIYFVVLKAKASLSKTVQIFTSINTRGLPLGEEDIFKVRIYEYLRDKKKCTESVFDEINKLYETIKNKNEKASEQSSDESSIEEILDIYKYILITKYKLSQGVYKYSSDKFFEQLFDTISNITIWDNFKDKVDKIDLSLEEITKIIDTRYKWENLRYETAEAACVYRLLCDHSYYGRFWFLPVVFLYRFENDKEKLINFLLKIGKLYFIYSIKQSRSIKDINNFTYNLLSLILKGNYEILMSNLVEKIDEAKELYYDDIRDILFGDITYSPKLKGLVCRLSAMLHENYNISDKKKVLGIQEKLFDSDIDIEHIQSIEDKAGNNIDNIWKVWHEENINSIGNLMILEERINRQIKDKPYSFKITKYKNSIFSIVKHQAKNYTEWDLKNCQKRKEQEVKNILNYLFNL